MEINVTASWNTSIRKALVLTKYMEFKCYLMILLSLKTLMKTRTRANSIQLLSKHFCMYGLDLILGWLNFFFQNECGLGATNDLLVFQNLGNISSLANKPKLHTTAESTTTGPCVSWPCNWDRTNIIALNRLQVCLEWDSNPRLPVFLVRKNVHQLFYLGVEVRTFQP